MWFDTSSPVGSSGTASFASGEPAVWLRGSGPILEILPGPAGDRGWLRRIHAADPGPGGSYDRLAQIARRLRIPLPVPNVADDSPRFGGGFAGCFSYDLGRRFEDLPASLPADLPWDFLVGLYDEAAVHDGDDLSWVSLPGTEPRLQALSKGPAAPLADVGADADPTAEMTETEHATRVARIREHIAAGTIYQANLTLRFSAPAAHPDAPLATFCRLREVNPSPYGAFLDLPGATVVSASPESFLDLTTAGHVRSRPIKGTAPRGATPAEDRARGEALLASAKDRAELSMIVDLVRNDVGRVCVPGSVDRRPTLHPEAHPTVWHLVGDVRGRIAPGRDAFDLLRASFPPGSCIGAPKIRAMAVLEELEQSRRGPYTGALGWIGLDGAMALSVAIRTLVFRGGRVTYGVGGGIVYDSDAPAEWQEALLKGSALAGALRSLDTRVRAGMIGHART